MIKIELQNIQAIGSAEINIAENTITVFSGDNSNGKSILSKVIEAVTSGDIKTKDIRRALIKDGTDCGVVSFTMGTKQLAYILREEISQSCVMYSDDITKENSHIVRSLNDKTGLEALNKKFGFRSYANGIICLQLSSTFGPIPFVTTSGAVNSDIVTDITVDRIAQNFLDSFKTITYPVFRQRIANLKNEKEHVTQMLDVLESYDWKEYESIANEMQSVYNMIATYTITQIEDIKVPPDIKIYELNPIKIKDIHKPVLYEVYPIINNISGINELVMLRNGICPTCKRPMVEEGHYEEMEQYI